MPIRNAKLWLLPLVLLTAAACSDAPSGETAAEPEEPAEAGPPPISIAVSAVERRPIASLYSTTTTLRADQRATVIARTRGVIRALHAEEGDRVTQGTVLATLEDDEPRIEHERAAAAARIRQREFARAEELHRQGLLSDEDLDGTRREHDAARHAAALAELALDRTVIRAPFAGLVLERHLDVGATVGDGTALFELADVDPLYADVRVPERHVARLQTGQLVRVRVDEGGATADARIERVAPRVDPGSGTVKVTLAVEPGIRLRPGAFVRVDVVTDTRDDALVVPRTALVAEGRRWHLYRVGVEENTVERLEVRPGYEESQHVEVLEVLPPGDALRAGERVVVLGAAALSDGAPVRIVDPDGETNDG